MISRSRWCVNSALRTFLCLQFRVFYYLSSTARLLLFIYSTFSVSMPTRILIVGHSHVGSLWPIFQEGHKWFNLGFSVEDVIFDCWYMGGARTNQIIEGSVRVEGSFASNVAAMLDSFSPHAIWLWVGDNDVADFEESAAELALRLFNTAASLLERAPSASFISIVQMLPRYHGWQAKGDIEGYNIKADEVNRMLYGMVKEAGDHMYYSLHGFMFPGYCLQSYWDSSLAFDGGIHLGPVGVNRLCDGLVPTCKRVLDFLAR